MKDYSNNPDACPHSLFAAFAENDWERALLFLDELLRSKPSDFSEKEFDSMLNQTFRLLCEAGELGYVQKQPTYMVRKFDDGTRRGSQASSTMPHQAVATPWFDIYAKNSNLPSIRRT